MSIKPQLNCKRREIRDIYRKLRTTYRRDVIMEFFLKNYFMTADGVETSIYHADKEPVDLKTASIIYQTAMSADFHL